MIRNLRLRLPLVLAVLAGLVFAPLPIFATSASFYFSPSSAAFSGCDSRTVSLMLSVSGQANAADVEVIYNSASIDIISVDSGSSGFIVKSVSPGDIHLAKGYFVTPLSGTETYAYITFTPKQNATSVSFNIADTNVADASTSDPAAVSTSNGAYNLQCPVTETPPSPTPTPTPTPNPTPSPTPPPSSSGGSSGGTTPTPPPNNSGTPSSTPSSSGNPPSGNSGSGSNNGNAGSNNGSTPPANPGNPVPTPEAQQMPQYQVVLEEQNYATDALPPIPQGLSFDITGVTDPDIDLVVVVQSTPVEFPAHSDAQGNWKVTVDTAKLEAGDHTFQVKINRNGTTLLMPKVRFAVVAVISTISSFTALTVLSAAILLTLMLGAISLYLIKLAKSKPHTSSAVAKKQEKTEQKHITEIKQDNKQEELYQEIRTLDSEINVAMFDLITVFQSGLQNAAERTHDPRLATEYTTVNWNKLISLLDPEFKPLSKLATSVRSLLLLRAKLDKGDGHIPLKTLAADKVKLEKLATKFSQVEYTDLLTEVGRAVYAIADEFSSQL